ncbi:MAG: hypothetical protein NVS3B12_30160 [Acidimicrobiales bacterium]
MTGRRRLLDHPSWTAALSALLGVSVCGFLFAADIPAASRRAEPVMTSPKAAADFLVAWRAHLLASWSVDQVEERTTTSGATLRFTLHEAQRPPDRVRLGGGATEARRGFTLIACAVPPQGDHPVCRQAPTRRTWRDDVERDMTTLQGLVEGPGSVYGVLAPSPGCWDLILRRPQESVPVVLGRGSQYCLDLATGELLSSRVQRVGAVDRVTTVARHAPATDADLALPADATY